MKCKKMTALVLALPLLIAGCSCNTGSVKNYKEEDMVSAVNYVKSVQEAGDFDFIGYNFETSLTLDILTEKQTASNKGSASYNENETRFLYEAYLDDALMATAYLETDKEVKEGVTPEDNIVLVNSTLYLNKENSKLYATITDETEVNSIVSVPDVNEIFTEDFFTEMLDESMGWKVYKSEGISTFYKFENADSDEKGYSKVTYELEFYDNKFVSLDVKSSMAIEGIFGLDIDCWVSRTDKRVDKPTDLNEYTNDQSILVENGIEMPGYSED